jgi:hypothetical protein
MSDEDSLNEMSAMPQRLMPRAPTVTEHHKVLGTNALHAGNTLATFKAHNTRIVSIDHRLESVEKFVDEMAGIRSELAGVSSALSKHGEIIGRLGERMEVEKAGIDLKKTIVIAVFGLLGAMVTSFGGYWLGHTPSGPSYVAPTHQQSVEIDQKLKEMDPDGHHGFAPH